MADFNYCILGKRHGNFDPDQHNRMEFLDAVEQQRRRYNLKTIFAPTCNFTNCIAGFGEDDYNLDAGIVRTKKEADGGIVSDPKIAVAIFNADCPIVAIQNETNGRLMVLHAGFRCLVPQDKKSKSIIETAFENHDFNPKSVKVWAGYGIGPCCYGAEHWLGDLTRDLPIGRATRGTRSGQRSVDLYWLIRGQLLRAGVPLDKITIDLLCTSCDGNRYYSRCRDGPGSGNNLTLVWITEK